MKKHVLIVLTLFGFSSAYTVTPERIEPLSAKVILANKEGYFALADGTCWKAIGFQTRYRSLSEWWNSVELVPKEYECIPNDWFLATEVEVYSKYGNLNIKESDASNEEALKQCTHLLVNQRTGQVLFAIALHPADCLVQLSNEVYKDGFNKGTQSVVKSNKNQADENYRIGYQVGYELGFAEGIKSAKED